jgi:4-aminobutyrate aminotransferase-like enzyme
MIGVEPVDGASGRAWPSLAAEMARAMLAQDVLVITSGPEANVIRLLPPLIVTDDELDLALAALERAADTSL